MEGCLGSHHVREELQHKETGGEKSNVKFSFSPLLLSCLESNQLLCGISDRQTVGVRTLVWRIEGTVGQWIKKMR